MKNIFAYNDYRAYLTAKFGGQGKRTGQRSLAAKAIGCHGTFISHVLQGKVDLSLEQAEKLSEFWEHTKLEEHFFLLLLQKERAGTQKLKKYFAEQIQQILDDRKIIANRVPENQKISTEDQAKFYSSWIYGGVHVLLSIPSLQTKESLAEKLHVPISRISEILDFLCSLGLAKYDNGKFKMGEGHVHLSGASENINKHHTNWRMQAIRSLDEKNAEDLHYSAAVTLSKEDVQVIRERLLASMKENLETIKHSKEEEAYVYCFDFFQLRAN